MDFKSAIVSNQNDSIALLKALVEGIRPGRLEPTSFAVSRIEDLATLIQNDSECCEILKMRIKHLFDATSSTNLLTQSGLNASGGVFSDLIQKIKHTILPPLKDKNELSAVISIIFNKSWDYKWVEEVPNKVWLNLIEKLGLNLNLRPNGNELDETLNSILILSHRIVVMGLDKNLISKIPGISHLTSPFFQQNREITGYIDQIRSQKLLPDSNAVEYGYIMNTLDNCIQKIRYIHLNRHEIGAGLGLTYLTGNIEQHVIRIRKLMRMLHEKDKQRTNVVVKLFKELVVNENTKNKLLKHVSANIGLVAYQVTENAAKTGEHYISQDRKEYWHFFLSSLGGGAIVALLVCIKLLIYYNHLPPVPETVANGLNYGIGFLIIHFAGFTLATKQPAMTASTLAGALESTNENDHVSISNLASMIVKISRTQFVSFAGNLLMVFPVTWLIAVMFFNLSGHYPADVTKAAKMIDELHPLHSFSLWYAAVAGILLFLGGLISGYFDNKTVFNHIPERIVNHPQLTWLSVKRREKFANYIGNNLGSMAGNFLLGIMLGSMAFFGFILGLPLDVRHVTFVTGNFGMAFASLSNDIPTNVIWVTLTSIVLIGFINFLVSFSLAIFTAMRARKVKFNQTFKLLNLLKAYLFTYPADFFYPPSVERKIELYEPPIQDED